MGIKKGLILLMMAWLTNTLVCFHGTDIFEKNSFYTDHTSAFKHAPHSLLSWLGRLQQGSGDAEGAAPGKIKYRHRYLTVQKQYLEIFWKKADQHRGFIAILLVDQVKPVFKRSFAIIRSAAVQLFRLTPF